MASNITQLEVFTKSDPRDLIIDLDFELPQSWKKLNPGKKVVGTFPVYVPPELIHAFGHLPFNIFGGGEDISISHADAILGSFICSISKSTTELLLSNENFKNSIDGYVFPFICDVARNLSGIFDRRQDMPVHMLHLTQNVDSKHSIDFMVTEYNRMIKTLFPDETLDFGALNKSIAVYNHNRKLCRDLYELRNERPWDVPIGELYTLIRLGNQLPVEEHSILLEEGLAKFKANNNRKRDAIRVVITGNFCEQPPMDIIELIEQVGCYIVDDEFNIGRRFFDKDVPADTDNPLIALSKSYIDDGAKIATRYHQGEKGELILQRVKDTNADGVIFLSAKFCEPALDDLVLQQAALNDTDTRFIHIEFEERGSAFEMIRLSLETFVESMLFD